MTKVRKLRYQVKRIYSPQKKEILLLLLGGLIIGMSGSSNKTKKFLKSIPNQIRKIEREYLRKLIKEFYRDRLVDMVDVSDDETRLVLTEKGRLHAMQFKIDDLQIKQPIQWDNKWRIVMFDIPEKNRAARDSLRRKLRELGFYELQKSVFIYPFECKDEIDFIVEIFKIRQNVKYAVVEDISNEAELKMYFEL